VQIADELRPPDALAMEHKFLLARRDRDPEIPFHRLLFNDSFDATEFLPMLYAVSGNDGTKAFPVCENVNGFENVSFALGIAPEEHVGPGRERNLRSRKVTKVEQAESR